jgi:recombinational DNA repair ATPase RecF
MLTRLEIDNFRCFEGFVWKPAPKQLILGANGCGKSSMMDALTNWRRFVAGDAKLEESAIRFGRIHCLDGETVNELEDYRKDHGIEDLISSSSRYLLFLDPP